MTDAQIAVDGRHIVARVTNDQTKQAVMSVLASSWDNRRGAWVIPATPHGAYDLAEALRGKSVDVDLEVRELAQEARRGMAAAPYKKLEHPDPIPNLKTKSWDHQGRGFWFATENRAVMLDMDMGTGKSLVVTGLAEYDRAEQVLVICPPSCLGVWLREFRKHPNGAWQIWNGKVPRRSGQGFKKNASVAERAGAAGDALERAQLLGQPCAIVINYETLAQKPMQEFLRSIEWDAIVADESHRLQDPGGVWSKTAATLRARRRICGTGTPFGQTPLTIYAQYRFLDPGIFGTNYQLFKQRYATTREIEVPGKNGRKRKVELVTGLRKDMEQDFMQRFERISYGCKSEDVQDLPENVLTVRDVELESKTRAIYDELDNEYIAWVHGELEGEPVTASNALVKSLRLQQIVNGYARLDDDRLEVIGEEKAKALADVMKDVDPEDPVVVFCRFVADLDRVQALAEKLGRRYGELSGRRKDALTEEATMRPDIDIAAVQLQSGGVGIDLTRARIGIYYSLCDSLIQYQQSRKRIHRPGQERSTLLIHLITDTAVERQIFRALKRNENVNEALLRAAREGWNTEID